MKVVKRMLLDLLGLVMGLVILLAGSFAVDFAIGGGRINAVITRMGAVKDRQVTPAVFC